MLLDVMLPDASGFELCRRLREARRPRRSGSTRTFPVIMLTGPSVGDGPRAGIRSGCGRLRRQAVSLSGGGGAHRRRSEAFEGAPRAGRASGRASCGSIRSRATCARRAEDRAVGEGVRAPAHARERADARVHQGGAASRRLGVQARWARRAPSTPTRAACGESSCRPGRRWVINVWGVGYRLTDRER